MARVAGVQHIFVYIYLCYVGVRSEKSNDTGTGPFGGLVTGNDCRR